MPEQKRNALLRGGLVFVVFMLYPVLATLTPVLDGTVAGSASPTSSASS